MASKAELWRRHIGERLAALEVNVDPKAGLLANVIGKPSAELHALLDSPSREAAVLVGLVPRTGGLQVLLTLRANHLQHHPGQVSFPGGRLEASEDPVSAALREASEEVALAPEAVDVLGLLPPRLTGTGFAVTPVVGWVAPDFEAEPNPDEVHSAFEVPVDYLLDPLNRLESTRERFGTHFLVYEFHFGGHKIWGATAAILAELFEVIDAKTI